MEQQEWDRRALLGAAGLAGAAVLSRAARAGNINPPVGPVNPTPGPNTATVIDQQNTPGNASANFRITQPGAYRLGGNLTITDSRAAISVESGNVTIYLDGHTLSSSAGAGMKGPGIVVNVPGGVGNFVGIDGRTGTITGFNTGVRVEGMPDNGAARVQLDDVNVSGSELTGVLVVPAFQQTHVRVSRSSLSNNAGSGLNAGSTRINIQNTDASGNGLEGIVAGNGSYLSEVRANANGGDGIQVGADSTLRTVRADKNGGDGIVLAGGKVNGAQANDNSSGNGIAVSGTSTDVSISDAQTHRNGQNGIAGNAQTSVDDSKAFGNGGCGIDAPRTSGCESRGNNVGIRTGADGRVSNSRATDNTTFGFDLGPCSSMHHSDALRNLVGVTAGPCSTIERCTIAQNVSSGLSIPDSSTVQNNVIVANGSVGVEMGTDGAGFGHGQLLDNRIYNHGFAGVFILGDKNLVARNYFFGNGSDVQDNGVGNKIAPIQCDPLTAGAWDNWTMNA